MDFSIIIIQKYEIKDSKIILTDYFIGENRKFSELSVLKGTFTAEGTGTTNCKLTLSVTEAPEVLSFFVGEQLLFEQH